MKGLNLILLICVCSIPVLSPAQTEVSVPETQVPLVSKVSASWCPYCGTWGWDFMESLMEDNSSFSNLVALHYSGDYRSKEAAEMTSNFSAFGQPQFFLDSEHISVGFSTVNEARQAVKEAISNNSLLSPLAQTGIVAGPTSGQLNIVTKTRFFQETSGEYFLGLYLVEKSFVGAQAGRNGSSTHKNVLRKGLFETTFGEKLIAGDIAAGTEVVVQMGIALGDLGYDPNKMRILSIIWKREGTKYQVVNSNAIDQYTPGVTLLPTANRRLGRADFQFSAQPNVVSDFSLLKLILPSQRKNLRVELWSAEGRMIKTVFQGSLPAGTHQWNLERSAAEAAGTYFLRVYDHKGQISQPIIFH